MGYVSIVRRANAIPSGAANLARSAVIGLALAATACAARGGVPLPFPGASLPPGVTPEAAATPGSDATTPPSSASPVASPSGAASTAAAPPSLLPDSSSIASTALRFRGAPYRNGGSNPDGFDCSGFVQFVFWQHGLALPRDVHEQYRSGRKITLRDVQPGDLLFFETVGRGATHVGVAVGGDEFVHAPSSRGVVRVERFTASYWAARFVGARRIGG